MAGVVVTVVYTVTVRTYRWTRPYKFLWEFHKRVAEILHKTRVKMLHSVGTIFFGNSQKGSAQRSLIFGSAVQADLTSSYNALNSQ